MAVVNQSSLFEVIGKYFADCFWINLYDHSLEIWGQEKHETLDDAYRVAIKRYNEAFCKKTNINERINKHYVNIVRDLYKNYKETLQTPDTYNNFIDTVVRFLLPSEYYDSTESSKRENIFRDILSKALTKFTLFVSQDGIKDVLNPEIRKNAQVATSKLLQWIKKYMGLLTQERNNLCSLLLAKNSGVDIRNPDEIPTIPKQVCDKLSAKIRKLIDEKNKMIVERNQFAKLAKLYKNMVKKQEEEIHELKQRLEPSSSKRRTKVRVTTAPQVVEEIPEEEEDPGNISDPESESEDWASVESAEEKPKKHKVHEPKENGIDAVEAIENAEFSGDDLPDPEAVKITDKNEGYEIEDKPDFVSNN